MSTLKERFNKALEQDNSTVCERKDLANQSGWGYGYFEYLGMRKSDLKKLERMGLAIRGYKYQGNSHKGGGPIKKDEEGKLYQDRHPGTANVKWVLLVEGGVYDRGDKSLL